MGREEEAYALSPDAAAKSPCGGPTTDVCQTAFQLLMFIAMGQHYSQPWSEKPHPTVGNS